MINVQAPNHGRARRILSDPDTTQNILRASYTEGSLTTPKTINGRRMPEHVSMVKFRNLTEWSDQLPTGVESDEDIDSKVSPSSPFSVRNTSTPPEYRLSDWENGIPQEVVEGAEADQNRAEEAMLDVMKDTVPEVKYSAECD